MYPLPYKALWGNKEYIPIIPLMLAQCTNPGGILSKSETERRTIAQHRPNAVGTAHYHGNVSATARWFVAAVAKPYPPRAHVSIFWLQASARSSPLWAAPLFSASQERLRASISGRQTWNPAPIWSAPCPVQRPLSHQQPYRQTGKQCTKRHKNNRKTNETKPET